jgi:hypothetical protein
MNRTEPPRPAMPPETENSASIQLIQSQISKLNATGMKLQP